MNKLKLMTLLSSTILFTACGGGGGDGGGTGGGNNTVTLTADIVQQSLCRTEIPATNAELVVYDSNWAIKSRHTPDAQGKITATIPATQSANIAFITRTETTSGTQIYAESRAQHPVGDLGKFTALGSSTQGCECQTKDVRVSSAQGFSIDRMTLAGATSPVAFRQLSSYDGVFRNAEICRTSGGAWPALTVLNSASTELAAGSLTNYNINTDLEIQLDQFATLYPANVDINFNNVRVIHEIDGTMLSTPIDQGSTEFPVLTGLDNLTRAHLSGTNFQRVTEDGQSVNIFVSRRKAVNLTNPGTTSIDQPDVTPLEGMALAFDNFITSDSNNYSIPNANQYAMFSLYAEVSLMDGTEYSEAFYGPMQGKYPENILPADYNMEERLEMVSDLYIQLSLSKYASETNYQSALRNLVKRSRAADDEVFGGDWSDYSSLSIGADVNL